MGKTSTHNHRVSVLNRKGSLLIAGMLFALGVTQAQQTYSFTNAGASGQYGPTQAQINTAYGTTNLAGAVTVNTAGVQSWTVPQTMGYRITAVGAQGGLSWGLGASMTGDFTLTAGTVIRIVVGQQGGSTNNTHGSGGGGSYVAIANQTVPLVVAGGGGGKGASVSILQSQSNGTTSTAGQTPLSGVAPGGVNGGGGAAGASTSGGNGLTPGGNSPSTDWASGGGGFLSDGGACYGGATPGGRSFLNNSVGGNASVTQGIAAGGFGGGGGVGDRGAGGGGYSGGGCGTNGTDGGGGGGSFNAGVNQVNVSGVNSGNGRVLIQELCSISLTASGTNSLSPSLCAGNSVSLTTNATTFTWSTSNTTNSTIVVSPGSTAVYSVIGTSTANCTAANVITVTVNGTAPVLSIANPSSSICLGRTVSVTATGAITYTWTGGITNGVPFTPNATQVYTVSGQNGCGITTATTSVIVAPLPVTTAATSTLVCQGSTSTLNAVAAVTGFTWQPNAGTGSQVIVAPTANTIYTVTASDGTCSGTSTISIQTKTTPTITAAVSVFSICSGESTTLTASGAGSNGTYSWTPSGSTATSVVVQPTINTLYSVVGTNSLGCVASAQQAVLVNVGPSLSVTPSNSTICSGGTVVLTASGGSNYSWTGGPNAAANSVTPATTTVYTVSALSTTNTCVSSKTVQVNVIVPNVTVSSNTAVCIGNSATLTASGATSYSWNGSQVQNGSIVITPASTANYILTTKTTSSNVTCSKSFTVVVTVNPLPTVSVTTTKSLTCKNQTNTLTANGASTYSWSTNATGNTTTVNPASTSFYTVTGTDANGCTATVVAQAKVSNCAGLTDLNAKSAISVFPNPNTGDFVVSSSSDIELHIINTIGQEVATLTLNDTNAHQVKLVGLSAGVYFISGNNGTEKIIEKVVIEK